MDSKEQKKFLTVAPFECAWHKELRFREAGRGCVAFEAFAHNDVTVVFREHAGSKNYHYKTDNSPHYTVIIGSHRNRRLKIEADGKTVVDEAGIGLCCSSEFQSYWISVYDGLISIGKGQYPFQNVIFQWLDSNPNCSVQYVGLCSWDKHVGYRNVNVLSFKQNHNLLREHVNHHERECLEDDDDDMEDERGGYEECGLGNFLEGWDLSDIFFVVGTEEKVVPAHKFILASSGNFSFSPPNEGVVHLPGVNYPILHALLQYIYTGQTQVLEAQLSPLRDLSLQFEVMSLFKQCEEIMNRFKLNKKLFDLGKRVEISHPSSRSQHCTIFPNELPINVQRLNQLLLTRKYCDVDIYLDGHGLVAQAHKIVLSLWSAPFTKMFTNGMHESNSSQICLRDVSYEAFTCMVQFMYRGELDVENMKEMGSLLFQLLMLADQFGISALHQECLKIILECLSEDSVCSVLQVVSSIPSCKLLDETCKRIFSRHFDYCTTASIDFILLDETTFSDILQALPDTETCTGFGQNRISSRKFRSHYASSAVLSKATNFNSIVECAIHVCLVDFQEIAAPPNERIIKSLSDLLVQHPDLTVTSEERILDAILLWGMHAESLFGWEAVESQLRLSTPDLLFGERLHSITIMILLVRFPLMPLTLLKKMEKSSLSYQIPIIGQLVREAIQYAECGISNPGNYQDARFQHRKSSCKELQYLCDGDTNGVIYYAGTSYGEHQWFNPVLAKKVTVTASSPASRYTDPKALVSRAYQATSYAGPRIEDGKQCAWWMVDVGKDHQLMCNYYTFRQDGSNAFPRTWALQGSCNGRNWTDLRVHENDPTICKPGQFASWSIHGPTALLPFRFFRVILTGPTTSDSIPWNLCICFFELYGFFH
ncbi:hypothetical protein Sjap_017473 [Stephania japonica]|uniref:BTB domain-containing protein n=1 Tax=Stephania japonica TaxID=461633 RepID=A0AAP0I6D3_9MAGN